jgi:hypothetical protein
VRVGVVGEELGVGKTGKDDEDELRYDDEDEGDEDEEDDDEDGEDDDGGVGEVDGIDADPGDCLGTKNSNTDGSRDEV